MNYWRTPTLNHIFCLTICPFLYSVVCLFFLTQCVLLNGSVSYTVVYDAVCQDKHYSCHLLQTVTPLDHRKIKLTHEHKWSCETTSRYLSSHGGRKCKQCVKGMRNTVNIALVLPITTALDDRRPAKHLTCPLDATFQHWSAAKLILTWTQQQLSGSVDTLRSESSGEGLSFLLPVYKETPVQYGKPQKDCLPPCHCVLS